MEHRRKIEDVLKGRAPERIAVLITEWRRGDFSDLASDTVPASVAAASAHGAVGFENLGPLARFRKTV